MFGYVLPEKPELKIKEYELFRAYYCGVCKSIGRRHGQLPRLTLNYEATFLALLLSSISDKSIRIKNERCIAHVIKKQKLIIADEIIDYASDINVILAYYGMQDNWKDDTSIAAGAGMIALKHSFKKLRKKYIEKCLVIEDRLKELSILEKENCASIDRAAEPFAKLMEEVMAYRPLCSSDNEAEILKWLGYNVGKWVYVVDAYDDIVDDIKHKSYNPFLYQYNYTGGDVEEFKAGIKERVEFNLTYSLSQIAKAYELLKIKKNAAIVENIIYMGMLRKTEQILGTRSCEKSD